MLMLDFGVGSRNRKVVRAAFDKVNLIYSSLQGISRASYPNKRGKKRIPSGWDEEEKKGTRGKEKLRRKLSIL